MLWKYRDFARAKSEALDSLLKQNIKSCNAKRRRHRDRWKNNNRSNEQKSNLERASRFFCTFLCPCFARLQRESSRNVLVTRFIKEMSYVFLFLFFFHCGSFSPWWPLVFLFFSPQRQIFHVVLPTKNVLRFLCRSSSLSLFFALSFAGLPPLFSFSLSFSFSIFQICGHDN